MARDRTAQFGIPMSMRPDADWNEARRLCRLSGEEVRMAREMGLNPRSLIKNIPSRTQQWKAPVNEWIRNMYEKKSKKTAQTKFEAPLAASPLIPIFPEPDLDREFEQLYDSSTPPAPDEIEKENERMLRRQREFRLAAHYVASAFAGFEPVRRVVLFGSVARPLKKEVPRFKKFRRAGQALYHECNDVDLAVWLSDLTILKTLQRARGIALNLLLAEKEVGVAHHQVDIFIIEPETDRYLGCLCNFGVCPKGKPECRVENCGANLFLRQFEDFLLNPQALTDPDRVVLFDRSSFVR